MAKFNIEIDDNSAADFDFGNILGPIMLQVDPTTGTFSPSVGGGKRLISGGASWSGTLFDYDVTYLTYTFTGTPLSANPTTLTIAPGGTDGDRVDAIVVDEFGNVSIIQGQEAESPVTPEIPNEQLLVQFILVNQDSTTPDIIQEFIYLENVEWTTSYSGNGTANFANTVPTPFEATVCATTSTISGLSLKTDYTRSAPLSLTPYSFLVLRVYLPQAVSSGVVLKTQFKIGAGITGSYADLFNYGLNRTTINTWQLVTVPLSAFGSITGAITGLNITIETPMFAKGPKSVLVDFDYINLQSGLAAPTQGGCCPSNTWGIYDSIGNFTGYPTLATAMISATAGTTIHLMGNTTETITTSNILRDGVNINLRGHTYTVDTAVDGISALADSLKRPVTSRIYDGRILRTNFGGVSYGCSFTHQNSNITFEGVLVESTLGTATHVQCIMRGGIHKGYNVGLSISAKANGRSISNAVGLLSSGTSRGSAISLIGDFNGELVNCLGINYAKGQGILATTTNYDIIKCVGIQQGGDLNGNGIVISTSIGSLISSVGKNMSIGTGKGAGINANCYKIVGCQGRSSIDGGYGIVHAGSYMDNCEGYSENGYGCLTIEDISVISNSTMTGQLGLLVSGANTSINNCTIKGIGASGQAVNVPGDSVNIKNSSIYSEGRSFYSIELGAGNAATISNCSIESQGGCISVESTALISNCTLSPLDEDGFHSISLAPFPNIAFVTNNTFITNNGGNFALGLTGGTGSTGTVYYSANTSVNGLMAVSGISQMIGTTGDSQGNLSY
jgi:hypothetical protein